MARVKLIQTAQVSYLTFFLHFKLPPEVCARYAREFKKLPPFDTHKLISRKFSYLAGRNFCKLARQAADRKQCAMNRCDDDAIGDRRRRRRRKTRNEQMARAKKMKVLNAPRGFSTTTTTTFTDESIAHARKNGQVQVHTLSGRLSQVIQVAHKRASERANE